MSDSKKTTSCGDDIWRLLTNDRIGFYTHRTRAKIPPDKGGVYAWFLPLRLNQKGPDELLQQARKIFSYDTTAKGNKISTEELSFNWDPLKVAIERRKEVKPSKKRCETWKKLQTSDTQLQVAFKQSILAGSFLARPLYVGLTNNFHQRYKDHIGNKTGFSDRYKEYMEHINVSLEIDRLIFVCIPVSDSNVKGFGEDQQYLFEDIMKIICQPVFGTR